MQVGITYDLREDYLALGYSEDQVAEFDSPRTVEGIEEALVRMGFATSRIGSLPSLVARLAAGERWDLVFNIAEGMNGFGRESQIPALLDYYGIPYTFSDPMTLALTLHKGMTKRVVRDLGLATADFEVVEDLDQLDRLRLPYPLFAKPVAEGTGRGIGAASRAESPEQLRTLCRNLLAEYNQPVLVETYLPGRELTVGMAGTGVKAEVLGVMEVILKSGADQAAYSYRNKELCDTLVEYRRVEGPLARACGELALATWRGLGCRDGGRVDVRCDRDGKPNFLEVNPLAGLHPEHSDLPILCGLAGISYQELMERIISSALERTQPNAVAASPAAGTASRR